MTITPQNQHLLPQARILIRGLDAILRAMVDEEEPERSRDVRGKRKRWHDLVEAAYKTAYASGTIGIVYPYLLFVGGDQSTDRQARSIWQVPDPSDRMMLPE